MKQLIPQLKIDEAAINATENRFDLKGLIAYGDIYEQGFRCGVQFTLNEIQPLMVEFANYVLRELWNHTNISESKSTQELLEEFIKSKNE
jgi:hypothetical protein